MPLPGRCFTAWVAVSVKLSNVASELTRMQVSGELRLEQSPSDLGTSRSPYPGQARAGAIDVDYSTGICYNWYTTSIRLTPEPYLFPGSSGNPDEKIQVKGWIWFQVVPGTG
jgi:hypothetical protein